MSYSHLLHFQIPLGWLFHSENKRNARDSREGHEKVNPKGPVKDVTDIGHTEFWPG